ncbi:MAG TPA: hypothetical protein VHR46_03345 [Gaiella sp.]|jgi:hypothetical protein|nr:hypothetical protein [Gaiella sp.]
MTAMLVDTPELGGDPGVTATIGRDEIEEALASDEPLDLILDVARPGSGGVETTGLSVHWQREDLESLLRRMDSDAVLLSFDRTKLARALDEPDFEGHGIREAIMLTVAAASASAAVAVSTASGQLMDGTGGGGAAVAAVVAPGHGEAGTASVLATPTHDEATLAARGVDPAATGGVDQAIATAMASHDEAGTASVLATPTHDEATLAARGVDPAIATAIASHDEAATARDIAGPGVHDETSAVDRGIGVSIPGPDESSLAARGIAQQATPAVHDEATLADRGIGTPGPAESGTSFDLPSVDPGTAAAIGGLAGAGLIIAAAGFAVRRNRVGTA